MKVRERDEIQQEMIGILYRSYTNTQNQEIINDSSFSKYVSSMFLENAFWQSSVKSLLDFYFSIILLLLLLLSRFSRVQSVWPHRWQPTRLPCPWDSPGKNTWVSCHFLLQCMKVKSESEVAQSCLILHHPMDCKIHGVAKSRIRLDDFQSINQDFSSVWALHLWKEMLLLF